MTHFLRSVTFIEAIILLMVFIRLVWEQATCRRWTFMVRDSCVVLACSQQAISQIARWNVGIKWYSSPISIMWLTMLLVAIWFKVIEGNNDDVLRS